VASLEALELNRLERPFFAPADHHWRNDFLNPPAALKVIFSGVLLEAFCYALEIRHHRYCGAS
jgi:hypothetical protein